MKISRFVCTALLVCAALLLLACNPVVVTPTTTAPTTLPPTSTTTTADAEDVRLQAVMTAAATSAPATSETTVSLTEKGGLTLTSVFVYTASTGKTVYTIQRFGELSVDSTTPQIVTEEGEKTETTSPTEGVRLSALCLDKTLFSTCTVTEAEGKLTLTATLKAGAEADVFGVAIDGAKGTRLVIFVEDGRVTTVDVGYTVDTSTVKIQTTYTY